MRSVALCAPALPHLTWLLYQSDAVRNRKELAAFVEQAHAHRHRVAFEIRTISLDAIAILRHVPIDVIFIGHELLRNLRTGSSGYAVLESIVAITAFAGWSVVAQGVEDRSTIGQLDRLDILRLTGTGQADLPLLEDALAHACVHEPMQRAA